MITLYARTLLLSLLSVASVVQAKEWLALPSQPESLQEALKNAQPGDRIVLQGGTWRGQHSFANSGTAEAPIVLAAAPGTKPQLTSLSELPATEGDSPVWQQISTTTWRRQLLPQWHNAIKDVRLQQLYCDAAPCIPARWPNCTEPTAYNRKDYAAAEAGEVLKDYPPRPPLGAESLGRYYAEGLKTFGKGALTGAHVRLLPGMSWWHMSGEIKASSPGSVDFQYPRFLRNRSDAVWKGDPFFVFGRLALLDAEREFYIDGGGRDGPVDMLYVYLPQGDHPSRHSWELRDSLDCLDLKNSQHITIRGIHFRGGDLRTEKESHHLLIEHCHFEHCGWSYSKYGGRSTRPISLEGEHCTIRQCYIEGSTSNGIRVKGKHHQLIDNVISYCAGQGVELEGSDHLLEYNTLGHISFHGLSLKPATHARYNHIFLTGQAITDVAGINTWNTGDMLDAEAHHNWTTRCDAPLIPSLHWNGGSGVRVDNGGASHGVCNLHYHHNVVWGNSARNDVMGWGLRPGQPQFGNMRWSAHHNTCERNIILLQDNGGKVEGSSVEHNIADIMNVYGGSVNQIQSNGNLWRKGQTQGGKMAQPHFVAPHLHDFRLASAQQHTAGAYGAGENWLPGARVDLAYLIENKESLTATRDSGLPGGSFVFLTLPIGRVLDPETVVSLDGVPSDTWRQQFNLTNTVCTLIVPAKSKVSKLTLAQAQNKLSIPIRPGKNLGLNSAGKLQLPVLTFNALRSQALPLDLGARKIAHPRILSDDGQHEMHCLLEGPGKYWLRLSKSEENTVWSKTVPPEWHLVEGKASSATEPDFYPVLQDPDLLVWLRPDRLAEGPCGLWANDAPHPQAQRHSASQPDLKRQPVRVIASGSSRPVLRFDGVDDCLELGPKEGIAEGSFEVFIVWATPEPQPKQTAACLYEPLQLDGKPLSKENSHDWLPTQMAPTEEQKNHPSYGMVKTVPSLQVKHTSHPRHDKAPIFLSRLRLGAAQSDQGPASFLKGDIAEILIFQRELSLAEQDQVHNYLNSHYSARPAGITLAVSASKKK
jgi:hypothetical protein